MRKELDELRATVDATRKGQTGPNREPVFTCPSCEDQGQVSVHRDAVGPHYVCTRCGRVGTSKEYAESLNAEDGIDPLAAYGGYTIATPSMVMTAQS